MFKYKNHLEYDCQLHQYITEYENIEDIDENNENNDEFNQFFGDLTLEAKFTKNEATFVVKMINSDFINMFFTSFENLQNTESLIIINLFADKAFKHRIICKNEVTVASVTSATYSFNATTSSHYDESEFKGLLINSNVAMRFTNGIDQLKIFQNIKKIIKINISITNSANFIFEINNTFFINTINLNTSLKMIVFHIMQINTFFLFCFVDMNKLKAFFNNIINQFI